MSTHPVLLIGGSGVVGRQAAKWLRQRHADLPLIIAGRNLHTAQQVAHQVGGADAATLDLTKTGLGLAERLRVSAVVMLAPDDALQGLAYAQAQGVPFLSIVNGLVEVGPEVAMVAHRAAAAPVIFASHWMGGAATFLALSAARRFDVVRSIKLGAIIDDDDTAGPTALEDMERVHDTAPPALVFENGHRTWLTGEAADGTVQAIDGRSLAGKAFSTFDTASLFVATRAANIRFDLLTGASSSRIEGGPPAAEIVVDVEGDINGQASRARATLEFKQGLGSLTGLCVALTVGAAIGLEGQPPLPAGVYVPELLWDTQMFVDQLTQAGATIL